MRVVGAWNALPGVVVEVDTRGAFKRRLERDVDVRKTEGYGYCEGRGDSLNELFDSNLNGLVQYCGRTAHSCAGLFHVLFSMPFSVLIIT